MAKSTSIVLNDRWEKFLAERIGAGRYDSVSEAVRAGLRLLEIEEEKFEQLVAALKEGVDSGPALPFDMEEWLEEQRTLDSDDIRSTHFDTPLCHSRESGNPRDVALGSRFRGNDKGGRRSGSDPT